MERNSTSPGTVSTKASSSTIRTSRASAVAASPSRSDREASVSAAQPRTHFELFGLPGLRSRRRRISTTASGDTRPPCIPIAIAGGSDAERRLALHLAANGNEAYRVLSRSHQPRRVSLRDQRGADRCRAQHGDAGGLPDATARMARGDRRGPRRDRPANPRWTLAGSRRRAGAPRRYARARCVIRSTTATTTPQQRPRWCAS